METTPSPYIQEISQEGINHIKSVLLKYQEGHFAQHTNFTKAIAAILEVEIKHPKYQEFAIDNLSQIVGIVLTENPSYLAIKSDIKGEFFFQVDDVVEKSYGRKSKRD